MKKYWLSGLVLAAGLAFAGAAQRPDQDRRRRSDHRPERLVRRAADQGRRPGGRGLQQGRRHPRPEDHRRAGRRRFRSQAGRLGRQQIRRRRRQIRRRPLQLRRDDPGFRSLRRQRRPVHHALGDQPEGHRPRAVGRFPHLRPRRPAGQAVGRTRARRSSRTRRSPSSMTRPPTARASPTPPRRP